MLASSKTLASSAALRSTAEKGLPIMGAGASTQRWTKDEVLAVIGVACDDAAFDEAASGGTIDTEALSRCAADPKAVLWRNLQRFKEQHDSLAPYGRDLRNIEGVALDKARRQREANGSEVDFESLYVVAQQARDSFEELVNTALRFSDAVAEAPAPAPASYVEEAPVQPLFVVAPLKPRSRCAEKAKTRYGGDAARVLDVVRGSIVADTESEVLELYEKLSRGLDIVRVKNRFDKPSITGYKDLLLTIAVPIGDAEHLCELQLHLREVHSKSSYASYCFFRPFFLDATPSQLKQRKDVLLTLPSTYEETVDSAKTVGGQFFRAIFLGADRAVRDRALLFAQLPLAEATSLKDLTSRLITSDNHALLETVADLFENVDLDLRSLRRKIVLLKEEAKGKDHRSVATALVKLAACETEPARKVKCLTRALPLYERDHGTDSVKVAAVLGNLGAAKGALGDAAGMRDCLSRALSIKEDVYGMDHPTVGVTLNNLGKALTDLGEVKSAREYLERALIINEQQYGYTDIRVAVVLTNVGNARGDLGLFREASEAFQRALEIYTAHGASLANPLVDLGNARGCLGDHVGKRDLFQRALPMYEAQFGRRSERVAYVLAGIGETYGDLGDERMQPMVEEALSIYEELNMEPEIASTLLLLATAHGHKGDFATQKELVERSLSLGESAQALVSLAKSHGSLGDAKEKCNLLEKALKMEEREYGTESLRLCATLYNLANAYAADARGSKKVELMERILSIKESAFGDDDPRIRSALYSAGAAHASFGNAERQIVVLERALAIDEQEFGKESVKVAVALTTLAEAYRKVDEEKTSASLERARDIFDLEGIDGEGIVERGPPPAPAPYERPDSPIPESSDDDVSYGSDEGIAPAKEKAAELYKSLQALEFKKQKILKAQEAKAEEEPQVDAGMTLDLGRVPWIRAEREHLQVLREELGDDWSAIASRLGTGRTALHCQQHVVDEALRAAVAECGEKNWGLVGDRIGMNAWRAERRWKEINMGPGM